MTDWTAEAEEHLRVTLQYAIGALETIAEITYDSGAREIAENALDIIKGTVRGSNDSKAS